MAPTTVLDFVNVFFVGMLSSVEFVIHYGLRAPAEILDEQSQLQLRQALVLRSGSILLVSGRWFWRLRSS
jgi:hypothetical protein